jgi:hypothetical protein
VKKSKTFSSSRSKFPKNSRPLPPELIGVELCLPSDVKITEIDWHDKFPSAGMPWRLQLQGLLSGGPTFEEERNAEAARVLALPDAEFAEWIAEQQKRKNPANSTPLGSAQ